MTPFERLKSAQSAADEANTAFAKANGDVLARRNDLDAAVHAARQARIVVTLMSKKVTLSGDDFILLEDLRDSTRIVLKLDELAHIVSKFVDAGALRIETVSQVTTYKALPADASS